MENSDNSRLDDDLCQCFHVSARKIIRFIRQNNPRVASQLSQCFGAGTGCGWCRPTLELLASTMRESGSSEGTPLDWQALEDLLPSPDDRQNLREAYLTDQAAEEPEIGDLDSEADRAN